MECENLGLLCVREKRVVNLKLIIKSEIASCKQRGGLLFLRIYIMRGMLFLEAAAANTRERASGGEHARSLQK